MRYKSCRLLEHGIYIYHDPGTQKLIAGHCCNSDHLNFNDRLYLYFDLKNEKLDWDYIFEQKRKLRENAKMGIYPSQCQGCFELTEKEWDDEDYISHLTAGHIMKCNSRCIYCPTGRIKEWHEKEQEYDIKPIVQDLIAKNLLRFDGSLRFVGGEPTLIKEFDWLTDLFSSHNVPEIYVPTSGIRLSKSLCNALEKVNSAAIVISVDSGRQETFQKIKGTRFYNVVLKNMKTYLSHSRKKDFVISKYILLPNYNDTHEEIDKWLKTCKNMGLVEVQFDAEHSVSSSEECENKHYINRTLKMLRYTEQSAKEYNIKVNSYLAFMNRAKAIYQQQIEKYNAVEDTIYENILDINEHELEKMVQDGKFSPRRRIRVEYTKQNQDKVMKLLRLGFDFDITLNRFIFDKYIIEILKTSSSTIISKNPVIKLLIKILYLYQTRV